MDKQISQSNNINAHPAKGKSMRVLEVNSVYKYGSTGRIVKDIRETISDDNTSVLVTCGRNYPCHENNVYVIGNVFQQYIDVFSARIIDNAGFGLKGPTRKIISIIKKEKPDIIHLHNIHGYYINISLLFDFLKQSKIPVVWTFHDCWPITGHCAYFDEVSCKKWKETCCKCRQTNKYPSCYIFSNTTRNYRKKKELFTSLDNLTIVTPSDWLKNIIQSSFLKNRNIYTINNGIDLSVFKPQKASNLREKLRLQDKVIILAVASKWGERKGFSDCIKIAQMLPDSYRIVLVGVSEKQKKQLPGNMIGIRRTESLNELVSWYSTSDVFLNLSHEDNFPTVNLESLACGLPIIAYRIGGNTEAFNNKTGIEVKYKDVDAVTNILLNKEFMKLSRTECVERAKDFDKRNCYDKYKNLFYKIIDANEQ